MPLHLNKEVRLDGVRVTLDGSAFSAGEEDLLGRCLSELDSLQGAITSLNISHLQVIAEHAYVNRLLTIIRNNPRLETFAFRLSNLTDDAVNDIIRLLINCKNLREVDLSGNALTAATLTLIGGCEGLTHINLSSNKIGIDDWTVNNQSICDMEGIKCALTFWRNERQIETIADNGLNLSNNYLQVNIYLADFYKYFGTKVVIGEQNCPYGILSANPLSLGSSVDAQEQVFFPGSSPEPSAAQPGSSASEATSVVYDGTSDDEKREGPPAKRLCTGVKATKPLAPDRPPSQSS